MLTPFELIISIPYILSKNGKDLDISSAFDLSDAVARISFLPLEDSVCRKLNNSSFSGSTHSAIEQFQKFYF
ncbi:hypothetical protein FW778_10770 [Ginsengibacter hankyongi]|uniref:Uncharacterized protein n=1 Tax=Ginsengibacter hankyongi TaxID=2607284 RepID=A0A5J5IGK7_9BACT|nr:hypothetical protein [Ginsengibacter hankyongi]KAA9039305.1 hypothetical protein FW778_10770 [Ginsengibacter hankyongi]